VVRERVPVSRNEGRKKGRGKETSFHRKGDSGNMTIYPLPVCRKRQTYFRGKERPGKDVYVFMKLELRTGRSVKTDYVGRGGKTKSSRAPGFSPTLKTVPLLVRTGQLSQRKKSVETSSSFGTTNSFMKRQH